MILLEEALEIVLDSVSTCGTERIPFTDSLGRILAEDIKADMNMPPFDKSAMDGYACKIEDIKNDLIVIETIAAGKIPTKKIEKGQCSKIMTGAMIPEGADCVLMVEHTKVVSENIIQFTKDSTKANICYVAEDVKSNDIVMNKGTLIKPQHIAVMSTFGCINPLVAKKVKVGILSTGDEIIEPSKKPGLSQIRNSNGYQLYSQVLRYGAIPNYMGIVEDSEEATYNAIVSAIKENDIVILTGGVSMGDFDFVPKILKRAAVEIKFQEIAVQPGKPTTFGVSNNKMIFGLPGNPVSSFIQFELLVKPLIYKMMGRIDYPNKILILPLYKEYSRKRSERQSFVPVSINSDGLVETINYHGSAHINSLVGADAIISIPIGISNLKKGQLVDVFLI